jgi:outer membrane lipoprotein-sorting protein
MKKHMRNGSSSWIRLGSGWLVLLTVFIAASAYSQHQGYRPLGDLAAFKKQFAAESSKVLSIESSFTQEKVLTALTEKITSTGKFWFKRKQQS